MDRKYSQRYQKALVTVAMGFRSIEDIRNNGLHIFLKDEKNDVIKYVTDLYKNNKSVLVLKVKQVGFRSEHINITSDATLETFIKDIDIIFDEDNEIWVISSSVIECWRCRIYISRDKSNETIEMAYSYDDHILDHIDDSVDIPYVCYKRDGNIFTVSRSTLSDDMMDFADMSLKDIWSRYAREIERVREDLEYIGIDGISLDVRINEGYDFHDFDVSYDKVSKVVAYYFQILSHTNKL